MHNLVKIITADNGEPYDNPVWHLVDESLPDPGTLCTGEFFGGGQSNCEYQEKTVMRGGITCPLCMSIIKEIKGIKL